MPILPYLVTPWGEGDLSWHGKQLHQATATSTGIFGLPPLRIATDNAHEPNVGPWNAQSMVDGFGWTERLLSTLTSWRTSGCKFTQALRGSEARSQLAGCFLPGLKRDEAYYLDAVFTIGVRTTVDRLYSVYRSVVRHGKPKKRASRWRRARFNAPLTTIAYLPPNDMHLGVQS